MPDLFLYQELDTLSRYGAIQRDIPLSISQNLSPRFHLREYQVEAFARFIHCFKNEFPGKQQPLHLLFNMATGSGKTLIMAGLILYLYEQGYRNFLFFVNSTNIIEKTRDNFLNPLSIKYLFSSELFLLDRKTRIAQVENFEAVNPNDISVCFTTIQKLHSDLTTQRENALTFEDFRKHKVVLISDEAHHMNVATRAQETLQESWENTVERIFSQNTDNLLLEFTATHDYATRAMVDKYLHKVVFRYDLLQFRNDRFSKDVVIVQSDYDLENRMLQALLISQYKQGVAARNRIALKPVILFKAHRTIAQSQEIKALFHQLVEGLDASRVSSLRRSTVPVLRKAFDFFDSEGIGDAQLAERIKRDFQTEFCMSVNEESEKEKYQILLNTLEDRNNRIRAIFAVQKLNEGWDVLNLFDIVRCYEPRDTGRAKTGSTTMSEAQLIGRGARYYPFETEESDDLYRRKFDGHLEHDLRVLEELHYHSINEPRYISEIRDALIAQGMLDENEVQREVKLKDSFISSDFFKYGVIWLNKREVRDYRTVHSFAVLGVARVNYIHTIAAGKGGEGRVLNGEDQSSVRDETRQDLPVSAIDLNIVESAIARNPFFRFSSIRRFFPNLTGMREFVQSGDYLGGLSITFQGDLYQLKENRRELLLAVQGLLSKIESEVREVITDYSGSLEFFRKRIHEVFFDKTLKFDGSNPRSNLDSQFEHFISSRDWVAFDSIYGTSEEKAFVRTLDKQMAELKEQYESIYLLRNESHFSIYDFSEGRPFQPDFVLFLQQKDGKMISFQMFIEPKGAHLSDHDRWKEDFLKEIKEKFKDNLLKFEGKSWRLVGVPFYNYEDENQFKENLINTLN